MHNEIWTLPIRHIQWKSHWHLMFVVANLNPQGTKQKNVVSMIRAEEKNISVLIEWIVWHAHSVGVVENLWASVSLLWTTMGMRTAAQNSSSWNIGPRRSGSERTCSNSQSLSAKECGSGSFWCLRLIQTLARHRIEHFGKPSQIQTVIVRLMWPLRLRQMLAVGRQ